MDFSSALIHLKQGMKMRRAMWADMTSRAHGNVTVELAHYVSANDGRPVPPLLMVEATDGMMRPFTGSSWDLLADDWEVAE